jgi:hypothetical protein
LIAPRSKRKDRGAISDYKFTAYQGEVGLSGPPRRSSGQAERAMRFEACFKKPPPAAGTATSPAAAGE